jgi:hypothetical protein
VNQVDPFSPAPNRMRDHYLRRLEPLYPFRVVIDDPGRHAACEWQRNDDQATFSGGERYRHAAAAAEFSLGALSRRLGEFLRPGGQEPDAAPWPQVFGYVEDELPLMIGSAL